MRFSAEEADWERMRGQYARAWSIWRSDAGRWYATRLTRALSRAQLDADLAMTVYADGMEELRELLAEQERRASGVPS
ncbi:hypothetical protein [Streptosporangium carneum]|uniref:Uncharacterized protein n=1 Tax=Streptosporangium carneum TaxID=47481 RepID=A0A9W6IBI2_9ACTN|nr:hypothetical protein [Streptosporangium carneum]GLK15352.1 hypothetical protein GCM10017600_87650 [Streptosporangium carneum]